ncbi:hypothetical protein BC936DRAFT_138488 [Jimgerdemannia flammicorona]|uniref:Uncharacterized protein n=1 Tax=Jimgerdemannia flammicorona TaxID=994334 RepID=A0A433CCG0_9FUNG|nr:hypothetical protein BC936DRAFT_138488 [Jimgerdemannia flammicorona]
MAHLLMRLGRYELTRNLAKGFVRMELALVQERRHTLRSNQRGPRCRLWKVLLVMSLGRIEQSYMEISHLQHY